MKMGMEGFFKKAKKIGITAGVVAVAPFLIHGQEQGTSPERMSDSDKENFAKTANQENHDFYSQDSKLVVKTVEDDKKVHLDLYDGKSKEASFKVIKFDGGSPDLDPDNIQESSVSLTNALSPDVLYQIGRGTNSSPDWVVSQMEKNNPGSGRLAVIGLKKQLEKLNTVKVPGLQEKDREIDPDQLSAEKIKLQKEIDDLVKALENMGL